MSAGLSSRRSAIPGWRAGPAVGTGPAREGGPGVAPTAASSPLELGTDPVGASVATPLAAAGREGVNDGS